MTAGLGEARQSRPVRAGVILVAVVTSVWGALDEYTPLLIESGGVSATDVALLMVVIWAGASAGGLLAGRAARLSATAMAGFICGGAVLTAVGALSGHPLGVVGLAAAFGVFQLVTIVADTRLQESISVGRGRRSRRSRGCRPTSRRWQSTAATPPWSTSPATAAHSRS